MARDFVPTREAELRDFATELVANIGLIGVGTLGLTQAALTDLQAKVTAFVTSYDVASDPNTRTRPKVQLKDQNKAVMIAAIRQVVGMVQRFSGTTNEMRAQLNITIPAERQPIGPPAEAPVGEVVERFANVVRLKLHDASGTRRGRPKNVAGATVAVHVGEGEPPRDPSKWVTVGQTSRTTIDVPFDPELPPGTKVHLCDYWYTAKGENSVSCEPISTTLVGGQLVKAA